MTDHTSRTNRNTTPAHAQENGSTASAGEDSAAQRKVQETAGEAKGQAQAVAQEAKGAAKEVAETAKQEAAQVKDEALQQVKSLAGTVQDELGTHAGTQQERLAGQARGLTDDLHRVVSGEQPQTDVLRQAFSAVADRAETLTQRLETAQPADLLDDVRGFAARRPGTFLAVALGVGLVAGRMTRGMRDASQQPQRALGERRDDRRGLEPTGVQADVAPHHLDSSLAAHSGTETARHAAAGEPYAAPGQDVDPLTGTALDVEPFDQSQPGGRA